MIGQTAYFKIIQLILAVGLFGIGVTNIGDTAPFFSNEGDTATRSIDENVVPGTNVGAAFTVDSDGFRFIRFEFPDYNNKFEYIVGSDNGFVQIKNRVRLNYEAESSYNGKAYNQIYRRRRTR